MFHYFSLAMQLQVAVEDFQVILLVAGKGSPPKFTSLFTIDWLWRRPFHRAPPFGFAPFPKLLTPPNDECITRDYLESELTNKEALLCTYDLCNATSKEAAMDDCTRYVVVLYKLRIQLNIQKVQHSWNTLKSFYNPSAPKTSADSHQDGKSSGLLNVLG